MKASLLILCLTACFGMAGCVPQTTGGQSPRSSESAAAAPFIEYETYTVKGYYVTVIKQVTDKMGTCSVHGNAGRFQYDTGKKEGDYYLLGGSQRAVFMVHMKALGDEETEVTVRVPSGQAADWAETAKIVRAGANNSPECP